MYYVAIDLVFTLIDQTFSIMLGLFFKYGVILSHYSSILAPYSVVSAHITIT